MQVFSTNSNECCLITSESLGNYSTMLNSFEFWWIGFVTWRVLYFNTRITCCYLLHRLISLKVFYTESFHKMNQRECLKDGATQWPWSMVDALAEMLNFIFLFLITHTPRSPPFTEAFLLWDSLWLKWQFDMRCHRFVLQWFDISGEATTTPSPQRILELLFDRNRCSYKPQCYWTIWITVMAADLHSNCQEC